MDARELIWRDARIGLEAVAVIDDTTLGPAVGGTRTRAYARFDEAVADARALARAMTVKCALAGLAAGGCKIVVRALPDMDRKAVFEELGRRVEALLGEVRTAGDYGTTEQDLLHMATQTTHVHLASGDLAASTGRGLLRCVEVCAARRGQSVSALRVAVQGCGAIGSAVAAALAGSGARVVVADLDPSRAARVAALVGGEVIDSEQVLFADVDVLAPCAIGGVIDSTTAARVRAWAVVGAANNILRGPEAIDVLRERGIVFVPDVIASAGAVVDGVGETIMGLADRRPSIDHLGEVARCVLERAEREDISTVEAAERIAEERLASA